MSETISKENDLELWQELYDQWTDQNKPSIFISDGNIYEVGGTSGQIVFIKI